MTRARAGASSDVILGHGWAAAATTWPARRCRDPTGLGAHRGAGPVAVGVQTMTRSRLFSWPVRTMRQLPAARGVHHAAQPNPRTRARAR
jgi:hypothetical protein